MKSLIATAFALAMSFSLAGCASSSRTADAGGTASSGSGVTVFGTIDAGVSGYSTKSERR